MKLSVVATLYGSATYIAEFCERSARISRNLVGDHFEILLINDGSPDNSLEVAVELQEKNQYPLRIIDLSRNFGHHRAMMIGCMQALGDLVFLIDVDLEEPPECLEPFHRQMQEDNCDVVYGVQPQRKGGLFERVSGHLFYSLFNFLSSVRLPRNMLTARLMTRRYVDELVRYQEREMIVGGLWVLAGFKQMPQVVKKVANSPSTYTLKRKLSAAMHGITSFSIKPLVLLCQLGFLISLIAFCYVVYLIISALLGEPIQAGWTSLIASIWLVGGMMIFAIGLVGIYISKIFMEVKQRPYSSIRKIYESGKKNSLRAPVARNQ